MPYSDPDKIAKLIPVGYSIEEAMTGVVELQEFYKQAEFKELIDLAKKVEGSARHASTHAAGVVVGDKPLTEYTPLQMESKGERVVTQYDMYSLDCNISPDAIGLLKMDFLGLRNLTILQNAIDFVLEETGKRVDMSEIPLDDKDVFKLLSSGKTIGIFQLESGGMRRVAKKLAPSRFSDITAMVALYRPGPMDLIDDFIAGKKSPSLVKYPHPDLKEVLAETYGIAVYQEQALQIANVMAGYTLGEADILRRAIGKKKKSIMVKEKDKFIKGAREKGYTKEIADKVWSYIEKFAGYGFNKAHATAYAMIAYQTAYMKAKYPVEFMAALLTAEVSNKDKVPPAIEEAKQMGIVILPPDINRSEIGFSLVKDKLSLNKKAIRFGMSAIKNVGEAAISAILKARKKKPFTSMTDFCHRVDTQKVNKKVLESLVQVGAFDNFGKRASLLMGLENIRSKAADHQKQANSPQVSLFTSLKIDDQFVAQDNLPEAEEFSKNELLNFEKELLGFYLTEHPLGEALLRIKEMVSHSIAELTEEENLNQTVTLGGTLTLVKKIFTKNGNKEMAFANLHDGSGSIELVVFPRTFAATREIWEIDRPLLVTGKVDFKERLSLLVETAMTPNKNKPVDDVAMMDSTSEAYRLKLNRHTTKETLVAINQLLQASPGRDSLVIELVNDGQESKVINLPFTVNLNKIRGQILKLLGSQGGEIS
jgi:DNA polymerase-3 subunit alpha